MSDKTPDQIRRETVPVRYNGLLYGLLGGLLGAIVWFTGWGLLHPEQTRRYPQYCASAFRAKLTNLSLFGRATRRASGMSGDELRYALLRFGNLSHRLDREILRHGWYPKGVSPEAWVSDNGGVRAVYSESPLFVFQWPLTLTLLTSVVALIGGLVSDYHYRSLIIAGVPFDGSLVSTVDDYNQEVRGDGMKYAVKAWKDR